ncbi:MFS transporter [Gilvimarinus sp. SDUM040013]|uniref:MFS transporter n=1 Tax=Gilvimarinus gilvus TaxID=3058038 RepID=A0ABU4S568_9GAMM|nr:MFS transporter [Gilvimarinus sp. SDUM040013]MDO3384733.1 MFS transporter [Gilvimarinus sp. SDUM040013]MDX6850449.1 MFS transporter [Gilvimarinus sp. SDUM040013]
MKHWLRFPRNVWVLAGTLSLVMTSIPLMVLISGLLGAKLAANPALATLPLACTIVGTALTTLPAASLVRRRGRRFAGFTGIACSAIGALLGLAATEFSSFISLLSGAAFMGAAMAFFQQFRFAAIESLSDPADAGPAVSMIMLSGIVSAIVGPEFGAWGRHWSGLAQYSGSFLILLLAIVLAAIVFMGFRNPEQLQTQDKGTGRPLSEIVRQPVFLIALASAAIGYAVMSFLMTSTPISMHSHYGHSLHEAKWVIQSHLMAMFLPSLFAGFLLQRLGVITLMLSGCVLYFAVLIIALSGHAVMHYWWALVLLGVGWNFLFLAGTTLLPKAYSGAERFKAQAVNDFSVFSLQAAASLCAGWVLVSFGWQVQVLATLVPVVLLLLISVWALLNRQRLV